MEKCCVLSCSGRIAGYYTFPPLWTRKQYAPLCSEHAAQVIKHLGDPALIIYSRRPIYMLPITDEDLMLPSEKSRAARRAEHYFYWQLRAQQTGHACQATTWRFRIRLANVGWGSKQLRGKSAWQMSLALARMEQNK